MNEIDLNHALLGMFQTFLNKAVFSPKCAPETQHDFENLAELDLFARAFAFSELRSSSMRTISQQNYLAQKLSVTTDLTGWFNQLAIECDSAMADLTQTMTAIQDDSYWNSAN